MDAEAVRGGFDPGLLDPLTDFLLLGALSRVAGKVMQTGQAGEHQEYLLDEQSRRLRGTRCYFNLESQAPSLLSRLTPRSLSAIRMTRINLYLSPSGCGVPLHFDARDVCIVQLFGNKTWYVSERAALPDPQANCVFPAGQELLAYQGRVLTRPQKLLAYALRPGCWLWVPRGVWHLTHSAQGSVSATLATADV